ncbi:type I-E CRISPR-associated protein Cse1/CasA [Carboxydochorda subterranea]|uniref:Type I-E CRISPR-associated protein Cse1/CasA n=1 Tax=Carboxydichorda subterranea TaxID=3109565 RepID=A0ABZ1BU32_9FIRM|nr:type I-E CRISPR-associated protein Cse1/CasA [Limnochorda sp. L945t]WRP16337.1 type I-E CRISPR-associated protein Cse1/CasA [Limnochorda sp. L945t]
MPHFNLLTEPWIPVRDLHEQLLHVGLRDALLHAHRLRRIEDPSPLAEAAFYRLLFAVGHRALKGPRSLEESVELFYQGHLPEAPFEDYFEAFADRFDLFHPEFPFFQVADLPTDQPLPWTKLLPELSSGNNPTLFDHTLDSAPPPAAPADAARALVIHQAFTPGGLIKRMGVTSGKAAPLATSAVFLPFGQTLFETLLLGMPPYDPFGDVPIWEGPPYRARDVEGHRTEASVQGRTRVYTWLSRSVRLLPESDAVVRYVAYGPGVLPVQDKPYWDPMCAYSKDDAGQERPVRLSRDRAFWRDFESLLPGDTHRVPNVLEQARGLLLETDRLALLVPVSVLGQVTDQAKVLSTRRETYPFPLQALDAHAAAAIRKAVSVANESGSQLRAAGYVLARALLSPAGREPPAEEVSRLLHSLPLMSSYWSSLETAFSAYLDDVAHKGVDEAYDAWIDRISKTMWLAWEQTVRTVGTHSRHLRAIEAGERRCVGAFAALKGR